MSFFLNGKEVSYEVFSKTLEGLDDFNSPGFDLVLSKSNNLDSLYSLSDSYLSRFHPKRKLKEEVSSELAEYFQVKRIMDEDMEILKLNVTLVNEKVMRMIRSD